MDDAYRNVQAVVLFRVVASTREGGRSHHHRQRSKTDTSAKHGPSKLPWLMLDDQQDGQASVGSNVLLHKPARMRVALSATAGVLSSLAPLDQKKKNVSSCPSI